MIVLDASVVLEFLLQTPLGLQIEARLLRDSEAWHTPHLVDIEVTQGLRRLVRAGDVSATRAADAVDDLANLDLYRHEHTDLLARVWQLRDNVTAYDAVYVALAEALDATLLTSDAPLARAAGTRAKIELIY